jgi:hypothetical protein
MSGKHFQLIVPNYDQTGAASGSPISYFRLGAAVNESAVGEPLANKTLRGDDLLDSRQASDPTDPRLRFKGDWRDPEKSAGTHYRDDGIAAAAPGTAATSGIDLSKQLISRGGWREHTDGNRVSTTRGDCLEVIGGNYKLIVMGRAANTWDPAGLGSASGSSQVGRTRQEISSSGHYNESTSTPGEVVSITWSTTNEGGTWTTVEQTDNGNVKTIYKGYVEDYYFGPFIKSYVGKGTLPMSTSSSPPIEKLFDTGEGTGALGHTADEPNITEHTYARSLDQGAGALRRAHRLHDDQQHRQTRLDAAREEQGPQQGRLRHDLRQETLLLLQREPLRQQPQRGGRLFELATQLHHRWAHPRSLLRRLHHDEEAQHQDRLWLHRDQRRDRLRPQLRPEHRRRAQGARRHGRRIHRRRDHDHRDLEARGLDERPQGGSVSKRHQGRQVQEPGDRKQPVWREGRRVVACRSATSPSTSRTPRTAP